MNERIKKLIARAGFVGDNMYPIIGTSQETALKNLAELIVLECADLVEGFEMTQQFAPDVIMNFEASWVLKEQFGIEE